MGAKWLTFLVKSVPMRQKSMILQCCLQDVQVGLCCELLRCTEISKRDKRHQMFNAYPLIKSPRSRRPAKVTKFSAREQRSASENKSSDSLLCPPDFIPMVLSSVDR